MNCTIAIVQCANRVARSSGPSQPRNIRRGALRAAVEPPPERRSTTTTSSSSLSSCLGSGHIIRTLSPARPHAGNRENKIGLPGGHGEIMKKVMPQGVDMVIRVHGVVFGVLCSKAGCASLGVARASPELDRSWTANTELSPSSSPLNKQMIIIKVSTNFRSIIFFFSPPDAMCPEQLPYSARYPRPGSTRTPRGEEEAVIKLRNSGTICERASRADELSHAWLTNSKPPYDHRESIWEPTIPPLYSPYQRCYHDSVG